MNEMNILTLNGEQYEVADKTAREGIIGKADKAYVDETFAPAIPVTMTGAAVSTDMVSPVEHDIDCKVGSKNIIPYPYREAPNKYPIKGLTIVDKKDGTFTLNGKSEISTTIAIVDSGSYRKPIKAGTYTLSGCPVTGTTGNVNLFVSIFDAEGHLRQYEDRGNGITFTVVGEGCKYDCQVYLQKGSTFNNVTFKPQIEKESVKTPFTPYVQNITGVKVSQTGTGVEAPRTFIPLPDGTVSGMKSISPNMTILTDNPGATIEATYNADTKKYVESKGGAVIDDSTTSSMKTWSSKKMVDTFYGHIPVTKTGKTITVSDASPVQSPIVCNVSGAVDLSSTIVRRYGKNIFDVGFRSKGNFADWKNPIRDFDLVKYYLSVGADNLAAWRNPDMVTAIISDNKINVKSSEYAGHGLGVPVPCKANTTYTFGYTSEPTITPRCSFYTMGGEFIKSYTGNTFTTPSNCGIVLLLLVVGATKDVTFSNIYFYEGKNQGYLPTNRQYIRPEPDGTVNGMVSAGSNSLNILSDGTVTITATYDADLQAHINIKTAQVTDVVLSLGGNV